MPGSVHPWDTEPQYPINRLGGFQSSTRIFEEEKNINRMRQNVVHSM
jgi:hypothetical protein